MSFPLERLIEHLERASAANAPSDDALAHLSDADFDTFVACARAFDGDVRWLERQALHCPLGRKLALLNVLLAQLTATDRGYASGASSGGEGAARIAEINKPGSNLEADRIRGLIRKAIMG
jgi:hypothetical protein